MLEGLGRAERWSSVVDIEQGRWETTVVRFPA